MNRAERRARRQARDDRAQAFAEQYQCPDCHADTRLTEQASGVFELLVAHDPTCPNHRRTP